MSITIGVIACFFFGMGVYALVRPAGVLEIFGTPVTTADGRNEVRAVYGGYGLTMTAALAIAAMVDELRAGVFVCLALAMLGMALGRMCSAAIDREASLLTMFFGGVELAIAIVLWMQRAGA
jgi:hypothetical protein